MAITNLKYWQDLVSGAVRVKQAGDAQAIGLLCFEAQERGEQPGAWHMAAQFYGYPDRCNCVPCSEKRRAA